MKKICINCNEEKDLNRFDKSSRTKDGYRNQCKECLYKKQKIRDEKLTTEEREIKRIKKNERNRKLWRIITENPELKLKQKNRRRKYHLERLENDPLYKLRIAYSRRINKCIKKFNVKNINFLNDLGCSLEELKIHIESKFEHWMNWENYGKYNGELNHGWDIDHILPLSHAKTEFDFKQLCHYTNLQPLCSKVNRDIKKDK